MQENSGDYENECYSDKNIIINFNEYWLHFGVDFAARLYNFSMEKNNLKGYINWKTGLIEGVREVESVNIMKMILDYWSCLNELTRKKDLITECFENFWDDSSEFNVSAEVLWLKFSWSLYSFIEKKFKEVNSPQQEDVTVENNELGNYLLFSLIENEPICKIKRKKSSRGKKKSKRNSGVTRSQSQIQNDSTITNNNVENMTEEMKKEKSDLVECGLDKYWYQRYRLFTKFDQGIKMDNESWYSVTPEIIAVHHAERCKCDVLIDPFCGCGGNTIQFARTCNFVIAGDNDINKLVLAKNNSDVYGVTDKIDFILADALYLLTCIRCDVAFLSPPWGGPSYLLEDQYSVEKHLKPSASKLFYSTNPSCQSLVLYLPRNIEIKPLKKLAKKFFDGVLELEKNFFKKKLKAKTVYFGKIIN